MSTNAKKILLINDLPGYGKVALAAMVPILSHMGHYPMQLPTAVISNTLDYGRFRIQDMTDYMRDTLQVWDQLGLDPDCICTGFVTSQRQVEIIEQYIQTRNPNKGRLIMVDPIMADGGKLYNGMGAEQVNAMRRLVSLSDIMIPNITEASFLTGFWPGSYFGTAQQIWQMVDGLRQLSGRSVVITSAVEVEQQPVLLEDMPDGTARYLVCGYDHWTGTYFQVPYDYLPVRIAGSGDIFSAVMTGELLAGKSLEMSVRSAVQAISRLILDNKDELNNYKGILLEHSLDFLDELDDEDED